MALLKVMESEEFLLLPVGQLVDIISSDELNVRSEEHVFSAVMNWVKYNVSERRQHLAQVCIAYLVNEPSSFVYNSHSINICSKFSGFATCTFATPWT